ncbi:MAG: hypothetical protein JSV86_08530 [Gemmatimonadota bacterium]|nr:MAG: hypothetical protein JSV86_08530 [Gemmatimonadota bacterium]
MLLKGVRGPTRPDRALPLDLRLRAIADSIPASSIDELWVFPPLPDRDLACEFVVLVCFDGGEDRRRILTAHVDAQFVDPESDDYEWVQRVREQGTAPQRWVSAIPDRLLQRLADAGVPEVVQVGGSAEAWEEALTRFANGNGSGKGSGNGGVSGSQHSALLIDRSVLPEATFTTIIEAGVSGNASPSEPG